MNAIPSGRWQRIVGTVLLVIGILADIALTPLDDSSGFAVACFAIAGPLIFWGVLLKYLRVLEDRILDIPPGAEEAA